MQAAPGRPVVALLTDFGDSPYAGAMRGVLLAACPGVTVVDLYHHVEPQNVREGAWLLLTTYRCFPPGTVFLAVVDPGVGTDRPAVAVQTTRYRFVGPDNGLLYPAAADDGVVAVVRLPVPPWASATFHGRDVFAPAAARLAAGEELAALGEPARLEVPLTFHLAGREGEVVHVDRFGNVVTNLPPRREGGRPAPAYEVTAYPAGGAGQAWSARLPFYATYAAAPPDQLFVIEGSAGTLEISVRNGSAAARLGWPVGTRIRMA